MKLRLAALLSVTLLSACSTTGDLAEDKSGVGVYAVRSSCPILGVPAGTGDITLFNPPTSTDSRAIDVTATITDVRATCHETAGEVISTATFTITALRNGGGPARQVVVPYFSLALRGGLTVAAKSVGQVALNFREGDAHAWARVQTTVRVNRAATTLPANVRAILTKVRKPGQSDAATDPLADPAVRSAVANATFEHLVGFQMSPDQLKYNATR